MYLDGWWFFIVLYSPFFLGLCMCVVEGLLDTVVLRVIYHRIRTIKSNHKCKIYIRAPKDLILQSCSPYPFICMVCCLCIMNIYQIPYRKFKETVNWVFLLLAKSWKTPYNLNIWSQEFCTIPTVQRVKWPFDYSFETATSWKLLSYYITNLFYLHLCPKK